MFGPLFIDVSFHFKVQKTSVSTSKNKKTKRGGGYAALLRVGIYMYNDLVVCV